VVDTLTGPLAPYARRGARKGTPSEMSPLAARLVLLDGMPRDRRQFVAGRMCAESARIPVEIVSRRDMPGEVPRTWIRDHA